MKPRTRGNVLPTFPSLLTLLFIALKLTGFITWSWVWVLSPVWVPIVIATLIILTIKIHRKFFETPEQRAERQLIALLRRMGKS